MTAIDLAAALIASWEGLKLTAYQDSGRVWTIGYGHTAGVKEGDQCTPVQARIWLADEAKPLFEVVADKPAVAQAAYVSFGYNCGHTALCHVIAGVAKIGEFVHVNGEVNIDLVLRRAAEQALIDAVAD